MNNPSADRTLAGAATGMEVSLRRSVRAALILLCLVVLVAFAPVRDNGFVNWDDAQNLIDNDAYRGFSAEHIRWMFTTSHGGHYQPLTWISYAADNLLWQGLSASGVHLTNVVLHLATAIAFFFIAVGLLSAGLQRAVGGPIIVGASVAAILFAVHPLRVESVAWATERRDVLSGMWLMLTVAFYLRAAQRQASSRRRALIASLAFFLLSLLSKAAGVVLPAVLLLLDIFPLRRFPGRTRADSRAVLMEKIPYVVPAVVFAIVAGWAQRSAGALWSIEAHPIGLRIGQAFYGLMFYLQKTVWPTNLSPLYEQRPDASPFDFPNILGFVFVVGLTALCWSGRRRHPALFAAWAAYVLFLLPVLGFAQSGPQVVADRYSYLSCMPWVLLIGAVVAAAWPRSTRRRRATCGVVFLAIVGVLVVLTRDQVRIWRDSRTLWTAAIDRGGSEGLAYANLASVLVAVGEFEGARDTAATALRTLPGNRKAHATLARSLSALGDLPGACEHYATALRIAAQLGKTDIGSRLALAGLRMRMGDTRGAIGLLDEGLRLAPTDGAMAAKLSWLLATCPDEELRDRSRALTLARRAVADPRGATPAAVEAFGAALAATGDFSGAADAIDALLADPSVPLPKPIQDRLRRQRDQYRRGKTARD